MKNILIVFIAVCLTASSYAQSPQKMSYQAVVRNASNALVINQGVGMQVSILQGSPTGSAVYVETQSPTTNANGLVSIEIGAGTVVSGSMTTISWTAGPFFIKTETDPTGGTTYTITGTSELLSVPYALHAKTAESVTGAITEADPVFTGSPANGITGTDITNWNNKLDTEVDGSITNEIQDLQLSGNTLTITNNAGATPIDLSGYINTDAQDLSLAANTLSLTNDGTTVDLTPYLDNTDAQDLSLAANTLSLTNDGTTVDLSGYMDNTDAQTLSLSGTDLTILGGNTVSLATFINTDNQDMSLAGNTLSLTNDGTTVDLAAYLDNTDAQTLGLAANVLSISGGNNVNLAAYLDNTDAQDLSLAGNTLSLTNDGTTVDLTGYLDNTDAQSLSIVGSNLTISGGNTIALPAGITGTGTTDYVPKFTAATVVGNSGIRDNGTTVGVYIAPEVGHELLAVDYDYTAGTAYDRAGSRSGVGGGDYNVQVYEFGTSGHSYNDYTRCGGVLGANWSGTYWGSLGYKNSASATYGVYGSAAYASGAGFLGENGNELIGIGSGFYGGVLGGWTRGEVMGHTTSGELYASYNLGNEYTSGHQADILTVNNQRVAAYANTSTQLKVYDDGYAQLSAGTATVTFSPEFTALMASEQRPVITVTAVGLPVSLYIKNIKGNQFTIATTDGSAANVEFSWTAVAKRVDNADAQLPEALRSSEFDSKMQGVMFNENNKEQTATPVWWDGTNVRFDTVPERKTEKKEDVRSNK